jgi:hypothetical protein
VPSKEITIEKVSAKEGTRKNGKPFTRYGIKDQDGEWHNSFQHAVGKLAKEHEGSGATFNLTYEVGEYGSDITELAGPVRNGDAPEKTKPKEDVDWDAKERRDFKSRAWAQAISAAGPMEKVGPDEAPETTKQYFDRLKPLQHAIWLDICVDILPGDEDIPF